VRVERKRNKITSLTLDDCSIGPDSIGEIAKYVLESKVLTELSLGGEDDIGDKGAIAFATTGC